MTSIVSIGARSTAPIRTAIVTPAAAPTVAMAPASVSANGLPPARSRRAAGSRSATATASIGANTARNSQWARPAATRRATAPQNAGRVRDPVARSTSGTRAATSTARNSSVATFSSTSRVPPRIVPPSATATSHRRPSGPSADQRSAPSASANAPASTGGSRTASSSWPRRVTAPSTAARTSCPGRADVPSDPSPRADTNRARHTYQGASNPTGSRKPRARYRPRNVIATPVPAAPDALAVPDVPAALAVAG